MPGHRAARCVLRDPERRGGLSQGLDRAKPEAKPRRAVINGTTYSCAWDDCRERLVTVMWSSPWGRVRIIKCPACGRGPIDVYHGATYDVVQVADAPPPKDTIGFLSAEEKDPTKKPESEST